MDLGVVVTESEEGNAKNEKDKRLQEALEVFSLYVDQELNQQQIAEKMGFSVGTVKTRLNLAREYFAEQIRKKGELYLVVIVKGYEWVIEQAKNEWKVTKNPAFLAQIRATYKDMRELLSLDAPGKLPQNNLGRTTVDQQIIMIINDDQYHQLEEQQKNLPVINGEVKELKGNRDQLMDFLSVNQNRVIPMIEIEENLGRTKLSILQLISRLRKSVERNPKNPINIITRRDGYLARGIIVEQNPQE